MVQYSSINQERISNGKKTASLTMALGKLDSHMKENETGPFPYATHKHCLKMDERPKCETGIHPNPREEHRQQPLQRWLQQLLARYISKGKGNRGKNELLGLHQDKKLLHSKGNTTQKQNIINRMGEDICK